MAALLLKLRGDAVSLMGVGGRCCLKEREYTVCEENADSRHAPAEDLGHVSAERIDIGFYKV